MPAHDRRPEWLKLSPFDAATLAAMRQLTRSLELHTVCESARCPNRQECFSQGTATFMILGDICTRNCSFCAVESGLPCSPDPTEPENVVAAVAELGLRYVVITSVTRDDLQDGGASHFARTVDAIHRHDPDIVVEALVPDFGGSLSALKMVTDTPVAVLNHNVETVPRLYPEVRSQAEYRRSLQVLRQARLLNPILRTKSGLMVGLGETKNEVVEVMADLRQAGCDLLTVGQYLAPSLKHHKLARFVHPEEFAEYEDMGTRMGFNYVAAGPLVRSSYHACEAYAAGARAHR
ncbi:MAG: lipoyl synthase [Dehalococcoidia bacterium]